MSHQPNPPTPPREDRAGERLAIVAHELRRPLTALLGALATVQQRGPVLSAAQQQEFLGMAHHQGTQMQRLVEQLLVATALDHPSARWPGRCWSMRPRWPRRRAWPPGWPTPPPDHHPGCWAAAGPG